jgi:hypothetical protein
MIYADQWKALSSRIRGLMQAGELHARFLSIRSSDMYARGKQLRAQCESTLTALVSFRTVYTDSLPAAAAACINGFIDKHGGLIRDTSGTADSLDERAWAALVLLGAFETEMSFILADEQEIIRTRSERAFAHLQRSIVADPEFAEKWRKAFEDGEVACEKLGGVHLLSHGIFAFKAHAEGERTDLVFQDIVSNLADMRRYADGFVLTEWKITRSGRDAEKRFSEAKGQADRYAKGALGGSELAGYRYLVVVSGPQVKVPADVTERSVIYRHVNIAVQPQTPSRKNT